MGLAKWMRRCMKLIHELERGEDRANTSRFAGRLGAAAGWRPPDSRAPGPHLHKTVGKPPPQQP